MSDLINGILELVGAVFAAGNCLALWRDRSVQGLSLESALYFLAWGLWNLFFYPAHDLWASFAGGLCLSMVNLLWLVMAIYFGRRQGCDAHTGGLSTSR